jgi:hypothetical protein
MQGAALAGVRPPCGRYGALNGMGERCQTLKIRVLFCNKENIIALMK